MKKIIEAIIFDMDGTLYQIDGKSNGYPGSSLEALVLHNTLKLVQGRERCSVDEAQAIIKQGLIDEIGLSNYLSKRYKITRSEYFNFVWDILPENIVQNFMLAVGVVKQLKNRGLYLILLTSAPKIWQQIVIEFIDLLDYFNEIYTGEMFGEKSEIFKQIIENLNPETILSIGDQEKSDVMPAIALGMQAILVSSPKDVLNILKYLEK